MKEMLKKALCVSLSVSLVYMPVWWQVAKAEDIDLFVANTQTAVNPNILVIIDNSANWNSNAQHWTDALTGIAPFKQGQSELRALRTVAGELTEAVNFGLFMFHDHATPGAYPRFHVREMNATNKAAFQEMMGDPTSCTSGANSLNGVANCIVKNFGDNGTNMVATSKTDYSAAMFEAFKYFGGYTSPANATTNIAGTPVDSTHFGMQRYGGTPNSNFDPAAYTDSSKGTYTSLITSTNACAKNYIIFIGNGFPNQDSPATLLSGVGGNTTQVAAPNFTTTSNTVTTTIGTSCSTDGNNETARRADCTANISQAMKDANPADSYACVGSESTDVALCGNGSKQKKFSVQSSKTVISVAATGTFSVPSSTRYADEWARFLATTDVSAMAGQQTVTTYTIDVFKDAQDTSETQLLQSMARYGGGKYYQATSESAILSALREILIEIQAVNTVFAAASLPINATNRSQNENQVFIGMFRPDGGGRPRWYGNLKRYQIALFSGEAKLADADKNDAVSTSTGFIAPCSRSFWTVDTGEYWNFTQQGVTSFAGLCTTSSTSVFSDKPDGSQVEKGAVAEILRLGNNPPSGGYTDSSTTPTPVTAVGSRTIYTCANTNTTTTFDNALVTCNTGATAMHAFSNANIADPDALGTGVADNTERDRIINFTIGADFSNDQFNQNNNQCSGIACVTDVRPDVHGDVAHSRPLPVNYGGTTGVVLYYGANDGTFRAVKGGRTDDETTVVNEGLEGGNELWAFIAPEHHSRLKRLRDNTPRIKFSGSTDTTLVAKDYFFDGSAGLYQTFNTDGTSNTAWVFPTMRRGGRMLYGFNVTTPTAPRMLWRVGCPSLTSDTGCSTGFSNIGQTWSIPAVAKIKSANLNAGVEKPVIIVGGGYAACEDEDDAKTACTGATGTTIPKGANVYVLDAETGTILKTFGTGGTGTIERSVAADVTLVDRDFLGFAQHAYFADTGGSLYRIDFVDPTTRAARANAADWTLTKIAFTAAPAATLTEQRKFLFAPAALVTTSQVFLTIGSGDRERPLITNYPYVNSVQNRFYMFKDNFSNSNVDLDGTSLTDLTSSNACSAAIETGDLGWRIDLNSGRGEQTVTSSTIFGGLVFWSTNRPIDSSVSSCSSSLGEARGYAVNLLNASGAVGTEDICGGDRSNTFVGGGLPPSPVTGTVPVDGKPVTVMIGGVQRTGASSSPIGAQKVKPVIAQKRTRVYWYKHGDK